MTGPATPSAPASRQAAAERTVSTAIVDTLAVSGVRHVFGIPGVTNMALFNALAADERITTVLPRHEQGAVFMADAYARASGTVGVATVVNGPGFTNALTPVIEAYKDTSPVVLIANEAPSALLGKEKGSVHELPDQMGMVKSVVKWAARISRYNEAAAITKEALLRAPSGRPRPVYVEVPLDLFLATGTPSEELNVVETAVIPATDMTVLAKSIARAVSLLKQAKRPVLYAGAGCDTPAGRKALREFAEKAGMPVVTTVNGKDVFPGDHPLDAGGSMWAKEIMESELVHNADLLLAVANRLSARYKERGDFRMPATLIHIDIDPSEIGRNFPTALGIMADATIALNALNGAYTPDAAVRADGFARAAASRKIVAESTEKNAPVIMKFMRELRGAIPHGSTITADNAMVGLWAARYMPFYDEEKWLYPMTYGTLGYGVPAAIGAKLGRPDHPVIALTGDGSFMYTATELATAMQYGVDFTVVLVNNKRWGSVNWNQRRKFGRAVLTDLWTPDFELFAKSFHCGYSLVKEPTGIGAAVQAAIGKQGVQIVEVDGSFMDWY